RLGTHRRKVHNSAPFPDDPSQQCLFQSCQRPNFLKETNEHNWDGRLIDARKRVNVFALSIYRLVIFPKALGHVDYAVLYLFNQLDKKVTPVPTILVETFRSLSACRRAVPLLGIWRVVGYAPILVSRQYRSRQFIPQRKGWINVSLHTKIVKQDFKKKSSELEKKIEKLEEEKIQLGLDVNIQKLEAGKMKKRKKKVEEDLDNLKMDYKKLCLPIRTTRLGKTLEQWRDLLESRNEKVRLRARVAELERSLYQYCSRNSVIELKASLTKIEELKGKIEELEVTLDRDHIMGEALTQVREVDDNLETLAVQADMLSLRYKSKSD
ncbi:hypothetical protein Goarm_023340, partial [Gossypium armourianum]|nr:hypothetical protein [Gossypium armourianum]